MGDERMSKASDTVIINATGDNKVEIRLKEMSIYMKNLRYVGAMKKAGERGVAELKEATPKRTGLTADSWAYNIVMDNEGCTLQFLNNNVVKGWYNVALGIQYGHATNKGGFVEGIDYINPVLNPIFESLSNSLRKEGDFVYAEQ